MTNLTKSTKSIKGDKISRNWNLIDLKGKVLGRAVSQITRLLQGKHKTNYIPNLDGGDYVVVINCKYIVVTGRKKFTKKYSKYSGYPGGLKITFFDKLMSKNPTEIIKRAIFGMLPKNKLRDKMMSRLFLFCDDKHPYEDKLNRKL